MRLVDALDLDSEYGLGADLIQHSISGHSSERGLLGHLDDPSPRLIIGITLQPGPGEVTIVQLPDCLRVGDRRHQLVVFR